MTWSSNASVTQMAWGQPSPLPASADGGIDFTYQVHQDYPMLVSADRPLLILSSLSEGNP